ncbi:MAG: peptidylprolyl isomerase [Planctomycetota bacterium]
MNRKALLASVLALAIPVLAEDAKLTLTVAAAKPQVALGENISLEVRLENTGDAAVDVRELLLDRTSLSFDVKWGERSFQYTVIRPNVYEAERVKLGTTSLPGKKAMVTYVDLPAVKAGKWSIGASYAGVAGEPVKSGAVDVEVTAQEGKDRLVAVLDIDRDGQKGKVVFRFYPDDAPNTVMSFVRLSRTGFYSGLVFHRVIRDFMIQGGCPWGTGLGAPGYSIKAEFSSQKQIEGTVCMARSSSYDSAGSQFYICLKPQPKIESQYTTFGQVEEGMDLVRQIGDVPTSGPNGKPTADRPLTDVKITSVAIEARGPAAAPGNGEKGPEPPKPPAEAPKAADPVPPAQPVQPAEQPKQPAEEPKQPEQPKEPEKPADPPK